MTSRFNDEELNKTLIAWLREYREINDGSTGVSYDLVPECTAAADRIEELIAERDQWIAHAKNAIWSDSEQLKLTEAKLEKAVAELERLGFDFDSNLGRELKGDNHE